MDRKAVFLQDFQHAFCNVSVFAGKELLSALNNGYLGAKAAEKLGEFEAYIAASDDEEMSWDLIKLLNRGGIKDFRFVYCFDSGDLWGCRPLPRIDEDPTSFK